MPAKGLIKTLHKLWFTINLKLQNSYSVAEYHKKKTGVTIGSGCRIIDRRANIFGSEPYLVTIGNNVTIADGVTFVTHDGGVSTLRNKYPNLNVYGKIAVGDNCFIGVGCILLPGVNIGKNCVIGAGAVVTKDIPDNSIAAGVPARVIDSIYNYEKKSLAKGMQDKFESENDKKIKILNYFG